MRTKDDVLADSEAEVAEARINHVAEQAAIRIIVHGTPEDVAINKALAVQNLQDHATPDQLAYDDRDQPIGYYVEAMQDLAMPCDERVARQVRAVSARLYEKLEHNAR